MKVLSEKESSQFIEKGFAYVRGAFAAADAEQICDFLWTQIPPSRDDKTTWTEAAHHVEDSFSHGPFGRVFTPRLYSAIDEILGPGCYRVPDEIGWFAISFPGLDEWATPLDQWWHLDGGRAKKITIDLEPGQYGLVVIPVLSPIKPGGGGTLLATGTHKAVAQALAAAGPEGLEREALIQVARKARSEVVEVNGEPGDVVLTHAWLLHARGPNNGDRVRFMANPDVTFLRPPGPHREIPSRESLFQRSIADAR